MKQCNDQAIIRIVYKLSLFVMAFFFIDRMTGSVLKYLYFKQNHGADYATSYVVGFCKADMIIMGSSRANHHYIPKIFENNLGISCYNSGRDGNFIFYQAAVLKSILKRYTPKIIILDIGSEELSANEDSYARISSLLPYYSDHPEMHRIIHLKSEYENLKLLSKIYPYNSKIISSITGALDINNKKVKETGLNGYIPLEDTLRITSKRVEKITAKSIEGINEESYSSSIDSNKLFCFQELIKDCNKAKIQLFILVSPYLNIDESRKRNITIEKKIAFSYHVPFYDFCEDSNFVKKNVYFKDINHLNSAGATVYTHLVIDKIRDFINIKKDSDECLPLSAHVRKKATL